MVTGSNLSDIRPAAAGLQLFGLLRWMNAMRCTRTYLSLFVFSSLLGLIIYHPHLKQPPCPD